MHALSINLWQLALIVIIVEIPIRVHLRVAVQGVIPASFRQVMGCIDLQSDRFRFYGEGRLLASILWGRADELSLSLCVLDLDLLVLISCLASDLFRRLLHDRHLRLTREHQLIGVHVTVSAVRPLRSLVLVRKAVLRLAGGILIYRRAVILD